MKMVNKILDEINSMLEDAQSYAIDAKNSTYVLSKNALIIHMQNCIVKIKNHINDLNDVISNTMCPAPHVVRKTIKQTLKDVGLTDMDDPEYGRNNLIEGEKAINILKNACKSYPSTALASNEDVDVSGLSTNLLKESYDNLPLDKDINRKTTKCNSKKNAKLKKTSKRSKKQKNT